MRFNSHDPIGDCNIKFKDLTVGDIMDALYENQKCRGITEMNIWKVKLGYDEINNFSTEDDIKNHGMSQIMNNPLLPFGEYYDHDNKKPETSYLHIFIVPTSTIK